jgi:exodeoxyribonuclease VII large subunit
MARRTSKGDAQGQQLGFDMGMLLPKIVPQKKSTAVEAASKPLSFSAKPSLPEKIIETPVVAEGKLEEPAILTVAELTERITDVLEGEIGMVWVEGEVSNLRRQASGHTYFTLKDASAQLGCVLFARTAAGQGREALRDGLQVQLQGQISVYQARGQYQLMVRLVQPKGEGVLQARFEELKRRLAAEGLFDQERKRPLPRFPRRIGVVTSPTGAAIRDFLQVLHRRHPGLRVVVSPVRVQGKGAATEIAAAIEELSSGAESIGPVDVIVVTRGGGSLEDLWEFNEEVVARAIAASSIPVVSAVGHEIDFSIADFVADLRAPTPSAAAELLSADGGELLERCHSLVARIGREAMAFIERNRAQEYRLASSSLFREPLRRLDQARQTSDALEEALSALLERRLEQSAARIATVSAHLASAHPARQIAVVRQSLEAFGNEVRLKTLHRLEREEGRFARLQSALSALSPEATLKRGFSITRDADGRVVTSAASVKPGDSLRTILADGAIDSEVSGVPKEQGGSALP